MRAFESFARLFPPRSNCKQDVLPAWFFKGYGERYWRLPVRGAHPATGGAKMPGSRMNGIWRFISILRRRSRDSATAASRVRLRSLSFLLRRAARKLVCAGNLRLMYIELHARSAFSFLEGASSPEELARVCARTRHARHGAARSRRRVRLAAFSSGGEEAFHSRAHRRGSHVRRGLALSAARRIARRLSEFVPPDHAHEAARAKRGGKRPARRNRGR